MMPVMISPSVTASAIATRITREKVIQAERWIWITWALAWFIWLPTSTRMSSRSVLLLSLAAESSALASFESRSSERASLAAWLTPPDGTPFRSCFFRAISSSATFSNAPQLMRNFRVRCSITLPLGAGSTPSFGLPCRMVCAWERSWSRFIR